MDRYEAQQLVGQLLVVDLGEDGTYLGELLNVITEPKKPWRGEVRIDSVIVLPEYIFQNETIAIHELLYSENEVGLFTSQQLKPRMKQTRVESYLDSILTALKRRHIHLKKHASAPSADLEALEVYIKTLSSQKRRKEVHPIKNKNRLGQRYGIHLSHRRQQYVLLKGSKRRYSPLSPSHFEYAWYQNDRLVTGLYEGDGIFIRSNGSRFIPDENDCILIDQQQFNPYQILQKELEPVALQGFEYNLALHNVGHNDLIHCYNALLDQLFNLDKTTAFEGVNFLTFQTDEQFVLVQHHFKRHLATRADLNKETIYDRFEFTTDKGKRTIALYTNTFQ
ncbi:LOW QUALITY PROTEIN: hypothetical protein JCM19045_3732 [Bacillus sp. JCM 19045]|nr:LOW QUALITY PROTEIN: hypothetical protein JCM19045_3732 [Bacillus sp. JCM 19045]